MPAVAVSQPVECDGMTFKSIKAFACHYGLNYSKVLYYARRGLTPQRIKSVCQFSTASKMDKPAKSHTKRFLCEYDGRQYSSLYEAALDLGFSPSQLYELRKRKKLTASETIALAVHRRERNGKRPAAAAKSCVIEGIMYESREAAARAFGIPCITAYSRMEREGITFEEALIRGKNAATYCHPVSSLFPALRPALERGQLKQPVLEELASSLTYYGCSVEPMRDIENDMPALRVDGGTYVYFNVDARGIEICTLLPVRIPEPDANTLNASFVAARVVFFGPKIFLLSFQAAKEEHQEIKLLLTVFFSHTAVRDRLIRQYRWKSDNKNEP